MCGMLKGSVIRTSISSILPIYLCELKKDYLAATLFDRRKQESDTDSGNHRMLRSCEETPSPIRLAVR
jgi:hypothetical protein